MLNARPGFVMKFLKHSLLVTFILRRALGWQTGRLLCLWKTTDWLSKARVTIDFTIKKRFEYFIDGGHVNN